MSPPVVARSDGPEPFLTSCVPLQGSRRGGRSALGSVPRARPPRRQMSLHRGSGSSHTHDLKLDGFAVQLNGSDLEVHPDGTDVALCVCVVLEDRGSGRWPEQTGLRPIWKTSLWFPAPPECLTAEPQFSQPNLPALCLCSVRYAAGRSCPFTPGLPGLATTVLCVTPPPAGHQPGP